MRIEHKTRRTCNLCLGTVPTGDAVRVTDRKVSICGACWNEVVTALAASKRPIIGTLDTSNVPQLRRLVTFEASFADLRAKRLATYA